MKVVNHFKKTAINVYQLFSNQKGGGIMNFDDTIKAYEGKTEPAQQLNDLDKENFLRELNDMKPISEQEFKLQEDYYGGE